MSYMVLDCPMLEFALTLLANFQEITRVALRKLSASPAKEGAFEKPSYQLHPDANCV
jgi:hypothetical protein